MKKLNPMQVRESLIKSGILQPESKKPFIVRGMNKSTKPVSKVNAILARRKECAHA